MFRDILKLPARQMMRSSIWKCPTRTREAIKTNAKPYIVISAMPSLKRRSLSLKK